MDIHFFAKSDIGKVRAANEDYFLNEKIADNEFLFIVADGMGGHQAGDVASKLASETFLDAYRALRRKGTAIQSSMELAVRKANMVVYRKAAADIEKRGMGTTFSAVVIVGMKAYIAHVGDSRIYLIRRNRIKRVTTDHSFVEKLVEEGRISADEARDHPQKNVLYMSLGARESFTPEIMNDIVLEDGDALVMCSDGLSNMLDDETIMNVTIGDYPQEAADALVRLANAHGGSDNITVQVIRLGSLEMMEKTKPIRLSRPRRKLVSLLAALMLLAMLAALWFVFASRGRGGAEARREVAVPDAPPAAAGTPRISEIESFQFNGQGVTAADCRFLSGQKLHAVKDNRLYVFSLDPPEMNVTKLGDDEQLVPSGDGEIYLLRRAQTQLLTYQLIRQSTRKVLLVIQYDQQVLSKESKPNSVTIYKTPDLRSRISPDYIDGSIFIFHDLKQYYAIANWQTAEGKEFQCDDLTVSTGSRVFFKSVDGRMTMLYHNPESGRTAVFSVRGIVEKLKEYPALRLAQPPLMLEYCRDQALVCYYPDHCVEFRDGRAGADRRYFLNNFQVHIVKVLVDMASGRKLVVNDVNRLFTLTCDS
jgi:serine/threonine protein phosphatase PrpC